MLLLRSCCESGLGIHVTFNMLQFRLGDVDQEKMQYNLLEPSH